MLRKTSLLTCWEYIEDIQLLFVEYGSNFIESSGKYLYFMKGEAKKEIYICFYFTSEIKDIFNFFLLYTTNLTKRGTFQYSNF